MAISYDLLWKLLIDKKMKKTDICKNYGISSKTLARMNRNQSVALDVLERICMNLDCELQDIVEIKKESSD
jgi:DNA (cytosine-5)-methyltransferase 1